MADILSVFFSLNKSTSYLSRKKKRCMYMCKWITAHPKLTQHCKSTMYVLVPQSCLALSDPMGCSLPGSSVHRNLQASILEWVAVPFSRGSSWPRDWTQDSRIAGEFLPSEPWVGVCYFQFSAMLVIAAWTANTYYFIPLINLKNRSLIYDYYTNYIGIVL